MIITIDLDNTLFNTISVFQEAFKRHNTPFYIGETFDVTESYPEPIATEIIKLFDDDMWYNTPLLNNNVPLMLDNISKQHTIYYVTNRTRGIMDSYYQLKRNNIHCTPNQIISVHGSKINALKALESDIHFDDSDSVIQSCIENGINCHMISNNITPYNHYLRTTIKHSPDLEHAFLKENLICNQK